MAILYPEDYSNGAERTPPTQEQKDAAKAAIEAYVDSPKPYDNIIKKIMKDMPDIFTNDEVEEIIKEVDAEWHPPEE